MANLNETPGWDSVPQLETSTPALGGPGGPMNLQAQALTNRIGYLKKRTVFVTDTDFSGGAKGAPNDDTLAVQAALDSLAATGGTVKFPPGVWLCSPRIPDNVTIEGDGQLATKIKLPNGADRNVIQKKAGSLGLGAGIKSMTIDGNAANNASGGVFWAAPDDERGPCITIEDVRITNCRAVVGPPSGEVAAFLTTGGTFGVVRNLDIFNNYYGAGWWHKGSDWSIENLWMVGNGNVSGSMNMIVAGGKSSKFFDCYFGGSGGLSQVFVWGSSYNHFIGCVNDNAWQHAYLFDALSGDPSIGNMIIGGIVSNVGRSAHNTFSALCFYTGCSENIAADVSFLNFLHDEKPKHLIYEDETSGGNYISGGITDGNFATAVDGRRAGGGSFITGMRGFDPSDFEKVLAHKMVEVRAAYLDEAPSANNVLMRFSRGGVSLIGGAKGYTYAWLQALQDDGTNNPKNLKLNPLGGVVEIGKNGDSAARLIAPNGTGYLVTVNNAGELVVTAG